ncbi:MAG: VanZ family protein [Shewanella sp.]|nr:VanZ family protein [Shewanella sp.]MCF1430480.1 VanZ family protein [Shewanella sp.]MCF1438633.1 VanZ family protein [Shewanella sp.]MCF1457759.1 VanZ family protein [Shewanella sp.]
MFSKSRFFQFALLAALLVVSYLVFSRPTYPQGIPNLDKVGHLGSFLLLSWLTFEAFRLRWHVLVPLMALYAFAIELVQSYLPYRSASFSDFVADMVGVALFYLLAWLFARLPFICRLRTSRNQ